MPENCTVALGDDDVIDQLLDIVVSQLKELQFSNASDQGPSIVPQQWYAASLWLVSMVI